MCLIIDILSSNGDGTCEGSDKCFLDSGESIGKCMNCIQCSTCCKVLVFYLLFTCKDKTAGVFSFRQVPYKLRVKVFFCFLTRGVIARFSAP